MAPIGVPLWSAGTVLGVNRRLVRGGGYDHIPRQQTETNRLVFYTPIYLACQETNRLVLYAVAMVPPDPKRRNTATQARILEAAWKLVIELGYARLTVEAIAQRAGVGKQTIYRWWPSKEAVLLEMLNSRTDITLEFPDTGDILTDLGDQIAQVAQFLGSANYAPYRALIAAAQSDPHLAEGILRQIINPRVEACVQRLKKAQADGQLRTDVDPLDVVELAYAPIYYRLLLHTRPLNPTDARKQLNHAFEGLKPQH